MASQGLIDAQFDRAVEIVQSLPKTGPIQTDYDEKLQMYSLYKQATVGNVKSPRPGIFDMLGRAKWDAWAKHTELDPYEAKWLYVEALLKVLRKYSDKTVAKDLVQELESYGGDPSNIIMSRTLTKSPGSDASGSTASSEALHYTRTTAAGVALPGPEGEPDSTSDEDDDSDDDEARELPSRAPAQLLDNRPQSSLSSRRYRTPMAGSLLMSPPPDQRVPQTQPLPGFETPSAFASSSGYTPSGSYPGQSNEAFRAEQTSPESLYPPNLNYRGQIQPHPSHYGPVRPASRPALERAIENVQAHLAALSERLESLETRMLSRSHISPSPRGVGSPRRATGSPHDGTRDPQWDIDDLGMWSNVFNPLSRGLHFLRELAALFARDENRSPTKIIVRRLCLDVSFLVCVVAVIGAIWRKSGARRREVRAALIVLWRAVIGSKHQRTMLDKGV